MSVSTCSRNTPVGYLMRWSFLLLVALLSVSANAEDKQPNFIVIFCDNLGYGDIEPFGSTVHRTPNLNQMAAEGRKFTHFCVTAGVCTPSRASLMTGCYSQRVGMHTNKRDGWVLRPLSRYGLAPSETTIAESLKEQGYATAIVGKWHLGDQAEFLPTRQGFDWFFGVPYSDDMTARKWTDGSQWPPLPLMENENVIEAPCNRDSLTKRYTEQAMQWIAEHKDQPFFLYFPQAMPGSTKKPFASPQFKGKSNNGPWGDSIEELDWSLGVMLDQLKELKIADNTLVVWTSDNGAPINRDGTPTRGLNRPLHGRGYSTAEGAFRVPTIVWQPGTVPEGTVCDELATTMDLLPTFAKLAGGSAPSDRKIDGKDIAPLLFGEQGAKSPYDAFYYYHQDQLQAVRSGKWKLFLPVTAAGHPHFSKKNEPQPLLFDVVNDISSENNVAEKHPDVVKRLMAIADQAKQDLGDKGSKGSGQRERGEIAEGTEPVPLLLQKNALQMIESNRGGRHWVDAETAPPKSPAESMQAMQVENGVEVQLVAAEPLVRDPVAITFDHLGNLYAVEYSDYPIGPADGGDPLSKIVMLEDTDADGRMDKRHVFADKLNFAHSAMPFRDGLLVGAQTQILFLKDTDGDHVADVRQVWFDGFRPAHAQMQIGNPRWGMDNWIHFNYGPGDVSRTDDFDSIGDGDLKTVTKKLPRKEFRFDPQTGNFEADSGLGQFGNTIDRWGNRFYCTNRNPIMTTLLSPATIARNPFHLIPKAYYDVAKSGGETKVFPLVAMKSNYLSHAGTHTSACGTTAYLGDVLSGDFQQSVFVCEPIGHLVTRSVVRQAGPILKATRAKQKQDFVASTDTWFRPASLATGPDGALYMADMYRLWVEHPKFLPPEISAKLDWRAGEDRGRIYRFVSSGSKPSRYDPPKQPSDYVKMLKSPNSWRQYTAQRLLIEGQSVDMAGPIVKLLNHPLATTRLHALWTLKGLGKLEVFHVVDRLADPQQHVRADAVKLAIGFMGDSNVRSKLRSLTMDPSPAVRFQVALALGDSTEGSAAQDLASLARGDGDDQWFAHAILSSSRNHSGQIIASLVSDDEFLKSGNNSQIRLINQLATVAGARGDIEELQQLSKLLAMNSESGWWKAAIIGGLGNGLGRHRGSLGRTSLAKLIASPPAELTDLAKVIAGQLKLNQAISLDKSQPPADRIAAIELLGFQPSKQSTKTLVELILPNQPQAIQLAAINAFSASGSKDTAKEILSRWQELGPVVRGPALTTLLQKVESTKMVLQAISSGEMRTSALSIDQRVRLLKHRDKEVLKTAEKLLGGAVSSNRKKVAKSYQRSLELVASREAGHSVYKKVCAGCHKINGEGHSTGPDLSDTRNRSKLALLYDILDPNSKVEPRFTAYSILVDDGNVFNGLIASETDDAIVLNMAEGKQKTINRDEIEKIKISQVSLMPEGVEKDVSVQQMADLLEFLKPSS